MRLHYVTIKEREKAKCHDITMMIDGDEKKKTAFLLSSNWRQSETGEMTSFHHLFPYIFLLVILWLYKSSSFFSNLGKSLF